MTARAAATQGALRGRGRLLRAASGLVAGAVFLLLAAPLLEGQGPYADELHQAGAAFLLLGAPAAPVVALAWHRLPLLNMPYSGAVKSNLFGLWLKLSGRPFSLAAWRLLGILVVAAGLGAFVALAAEALGAAGTGTFVLLVVLDASVLLTTRHDWGPTALALALRLLWLALLVREEEAEDSSPRRLFWLGFLPAFSVFEKLSNVVLLGPLALFLFLSRKRLGVARLQPLGVGLAIGLLPLGLVNLLSGGLSFRTRCRARPGRITGSRRPLANTWRSPRQSPLPGEIAFSGQPGPC